MRTRNLTLLLLALGCSRSSDSAERQDSAKTAAPPTTVARTSDSTRAPDTCPATGKWAICSFEKRMRRSGFVLTREAGEARDRVGFAVKPVKYAVGHGSLELFIYPDSAAAAADMAGLDSATATPPGEGGWWPPSPTLIRSANLITVFFEQTPRQAERLILAVTAGPPSN